MLKKKRYKKEEKEKMNKKEISIIKKKALEDKVPIIMDDTLEVIAKILDEIKPKKILEIGTAVGYSAICFSEYLQENGKANSSIIDLFSKTFKIPKIEKEWQEELQQSSKGVKLLSSNPKYQKYKQYFRKWINDQYAKKEEIQKRGKREDEQERD